MPRITQKRTVRIELFNSETNQRILAISQKADKSIEVELLVDGEPTPYELSQDEAAALAHGLAGLGITPTPAAKPTRPAVNPNPGQPTGTAPVTRVPRIDA